LSKSKKNRYLIQKLKVVVLLDKHELTVVAFRPHHSLVPYFVQSWGYAKAFLIKKIVNSYEYYDKASKRRKKTSIILIANVVGLDRARIRHDTLDLAVEHDRPRIQLLVMVKHERIGLVHHAENHACA
jgi:hypothetical protein